MLKLVKMCQIITHHQHPFSSENKTMFTMCNVFKWNNVEYVNFVSVRLTYESGMTV